HGAVVDTRVLEGGRTGFTGHVRVVPLAPAGLFELGHADADDEHALTRASACAAGAAYCHRSDSPRPAVRRKSACDTLSHQGMCDITSRQLCVGYGEIGR